MKLRNLLIAFFCLLVFVAMGFFYVRMWVVQKPRQIILFVSDAMSSRTLAAARIQAGSTNANMEMEQFPYSALLRNGSTDYSVPDTASASTAIATGLLVPHRSVSVTDKGRALDTILERANSAGRAVGVVSNVSLTAPSIASFYAHTTRPNNGEEVAYQLFERDWIRVALGGGAADFLPQDEGRRADKRDLLADLKAKTQRVRVVRTKAELENVPTTESGRVVGVFSPGAMPYATTMESGNQVPSLADMTRRAIGLLRGQRGGYVLVVDASLYTSACEMNQAEKAMGEVRALDEAVATARREAGDKALIMVVGRNGVGGMTLSGYPIRQQKDIFAISPEGYPFITWASGPNGGQPGATGVRQQPAAVMQASALNNAEDMIVIGCGPGAEQLRGFLDSTVIFKIISDAL